MVHTKKLASAAKKSARSSKSKSRNLVKEKTPPNVTGFRGNRVQKKTHRQPSSRPQLILGAPRHREYDSRQVGPMSVYGAGIQPGFQPWDQSVTLIDLSPILSPQHYVSPGSINSGNRGRKMRAAEARRRAKFMARGRHDNFNEITFQTPPGVLFKDWKPMFI